MKKILNLQINIITVPTPIDKFPKPDLKPLLKAQKLLEKSTKSKFEGYESTVYLAVLKRNVCQF